MRNLSALGAASLLAAAAAWGQNQPRQDRNSQPSQPPAPSPTQAQPPSNSPAEAPVASSSRTIEGTVESLTEGKVMKVKMADGKTKTFALRDASVDQSVKVGSPVRVTQSTDVNGKRTLTVEAGRSE
jgi:biotin carboxyl carrier protein